MKAVYYTKYGPPDVLQLREAEKPAVRDGEILIKVHASTVTAVDCNFRQGKPFIAKLFTGLMRPKRPVLGTEFAGVVEATGQGVTRFTEGDCVFGTTIGFGAYAEYICFPERKLTLEKVPSGITFDQAAACDGFLTALPFLRDKGKITSGQKVLIYGASGSVGTAAVQLADHFGAEVTGMCSTANLELVKSLKAANVIDYTKEDFADGGKTYDIIFDAVGKLSFSRCKRSLKSKGIFLTTDLVPTILPQMLWTSIIGGKKARIAFTGLRPVSERTKDLTIIKELIEAGKIKPVIDRHYTLEQIAEAHRYVEQGHKRGNVIILVESESKS
ncbi:MAG: NAD(P)-dependent alcohol dehydrogenase [Candidatus Zixiibacteriota bacterium]